MGQATTTEVNGTFTDFTKQNRLEELQKKRNEVTKQMIRLEIMLELIDVEEKRIKTGD